MDIKKALEEYKILGDYFAPDYEQDNEVLTEFKLNNQNLSSDQVAELVYILENSTEIVEKYFVADVLYLYDRLDEALLEPLLNIAIDHKDPSFNRIFLRPCIASFGSKIVDDVLAGKFNQANIIERIGISKLLYWLHPSENGEVDKLHRTILEQANKTENLIELYYYKLSYAEKIKSGYTIPGNAKDLIKAIKGHDEYEDLLFNKLGWTRVS